MAQQTEKPSVMDLIMSCEKFPSAVEGNIQALFEATHTLSLQERQAVTNFLVGALSTVVPEDKWRELLTSAVRAAKLSTGGKL